MPCSVCRFSQKRGPVTETQCGLGADGALAMPEFADPTCIVCIDQKASLGPKVGLAGHVRERAFGAEEGSSPGRERAIAL